MENSVSTTSPQTLGQVAENFSMNVQKRFNIFFTEKNFSSPWTGRLLFWQSLLKIFDERPFFFQLIVRKWRENQEMFSKFIVL